MAHLCCCDYTHWTIVWSVGFSCFLFLRAMKGFLAGGQNHFGSLSATSQSWLWFKATSVAGPEGQAYPLDGIGFKHGGLLPLDISSLGFCGCFAWPTSPSAGAAASLLSLFAVLTLSSQIFTSSFVVSFPAGVCCACRVLCRWAPVLAHLLSGAAACVRALRLTEFNSLSCYSLPLWLAVDW